MSGWNSLSGYLHFRPGGGGLSILKTKRKVWCVLDEGQCKLVYYKNEEELRHNKTPIGSINIKGAGISLDLDTHNQFIILSDGKEYIFTAENHESLMIWLIGLQAKRESYIKDQNKVVTAPEGKSHCNKRVIGIDNCESNIPMGVTRRKVNWQTYKNQKVAESLDSALYRTKTQPIAIPMEAPKLSSAHTTLCLSRSYDVPRKYTIAGLENLSRSFRDQGHKRLLQRRESSSGDSDEVFDLSEQYQQSDDRHYLAYLQKLDTIDSASDSSPTIDPVERKEVGSCSSLSSDSAIDRGDASSAELAGRLQDLEKELISTKCELAKVMNRQSSYQELLVQREDAIRFLEGRLDTSSVSELAKTGSGKSSSKNDKDLQERLRVLQNQNKFLNEEVKKLAKLRETDRNSFYQQEEKIRTLEAEIEKWKLDYVLLIQSSIRFPTGDSVEDAELILFGGDRHKIRIKRLLEEARRINPGLPTYESLSNQEVHVDSYGFRHKFEDQSLLLHYLCQELAQHYLSQAGTYEEHQKRWTHFMRQHGKSIASHPKELKPLCRGGIPDRFRKQVWRQLVHFKCKDIMEEKGPHYFRNLCSHLPDSPLASQYRKQISLDLMRTMPSNIKFSSPGSKGIMDLQDVLLAYCCHNPTIGYCQGMNFIVGMALLFMDAQDAFWTLVAVAEKFFSNHYFDQNLIGAQADQHVLKDLLAHRLPQLYRHLEAIDIELSTVTLNWFLAIFFDAVPFMTLLRVWDCFLMEGPKVLFRFSMAILKIHEKDIIQRSDTISVMRHVKASAKLSFDVEGLVKVAFEGQFTKRNIICTKQACYLNTLKEKYKKKELQRLAFTEREHLYMQMEAESGNFMAIGTAVVFDEGKVWYCYGDQHIGKVCKVTCEEGLMFDMPVQFDTRIMCMCRVNANVVLVGTLSWVIYAYSAVTRECLWSLRLNDAILSLCVYCDEDSPNIRIFAGLADGTCAVLEQQSIEKPAPGNDVMYISIGQAPVACLLLLDEMLWCASGNTVYIIHASLSENITLDGMDNFNVSVNPYDHILAMVSSEYGIWITLRGSSILELWDPRSLHCKMLYDTRTDRYPQLRKEDDTYFNRSRITAVMDMGHSVWIGTGEGNMMVYEVAEHINFKTPTTDMSPSIDTPSSLSGKLFLSPSPRNGSSLSSRGRRRKDRERSRSKSPRESIAKPSFSVGVEENTGKCIDKVDKKPLKRSLSSEISISQLQVKSLEVSNLASDTNSTGSVTPKNVSPRLKHLEKKPAIERNILEERDSSTESYEKERRDSHGSVIEVRKNVENDEKEADQPVNENEEKGKIVKEISLDSEEGDSKMAGNGEENQPQEISHDGNLQNRPTDLKLKVNNRRNWLSSNKGKGQNFIDELDIALTQLNGVIDKAKSRNGCVSSGQKVIGKDELLQTDRKEETEEKKSTQKRSEENTHKFVNENGYLECNGESNLEENVALEQKTLCNFEEISRHHKVNTWLSSLEETEKLGESEQGAEQDNNSLNESGFSDSSIAQDSDNMQSQSSNDKSDKKNEHDTVKTSPEKTKDSVEKLILTKQNSVQSDNSSGKNSKNSDSSSPRRKSVNSDESSNNKGSRLRTKRLSERMIAYNNRQKTMERIESVDSEMAAAAAKIGSHDPEVQYRLDFSGMYIETDSEMDGARQSRSDSISDLSLLESRRQSAMEEPFTPAMDKVFMMELNKLDNWTIASASASASASNSAVTTPADTKMLELMQTPSLMSRHISVNKVARERLDWNDISSNKLSITSARSSMDFNKVQDFLRTPSISSKASSVWSSYDEISTPSVKDDEVDADGFGRRIQTLSGLISHTTSNSSLCSMVDSLYTVDVTLQAKVKISDKPVRSFVKTRSCGEPCVISFSGCYGDDESVLKWRKEPNERLWTNEPVLVMCPKTKQTILPSYMRGRLSSISSGSSTQSGFSFHSANSQNRMH
ncbi:uncharacterized protein LOC127729029 isoform X4 [Mytilus californianus]|uniref:uncharacterized protein LOC127729029 isoform X4 n=1 Tax=Mytilus californianus TaxID=6549 RepID=UPI0022450CA9|nr:uncharacterized protein LOC127729029 isoform X4 [Mytilus californianus]